MPWPVLLVVLSAAPQPAASPAPVDSELAAAARREATRRARIARPDRRSYTDEDLQHDQPAAASASPAPAAPPAVSYAAPVPAPARSGDDLPPKEGNRSRDSPIPDTVGHSEDSSERREPAEGGEWLRRADHMRSRLAEARQRVAGNHEKQDAVREKLNPMSSNFTTDTNQQLQAQAELTELQREEQSLLQTVAEVEADLADLRESARRKGVPARALEPSAQE